MGKYIDLTGRSFGYWFVNKRAENNNQNKPRWLCICRCGIEKTVTGHSLKNGNSQSCGCLHKEIVKVSSTKHGKRKTAEYIVWQNMIKRCYNSKTQYYEDYGGRGVSVCKEWRDDFSLFYRDMGERPSPQHSLDRIDTNGNYETSNCRWTTKSMQAFNQRKRSTNTSGVTGVKKGNGAWVAHIGVNGKRISLGTFKNFEDAVMARKEAEKSYWNEPSL